MQDISRVHIFRHSTSNIPQVLPQSMVSMFQDLLLVHNYRGRNLVGKIEYRMDDIAMVENDFPGIDTVLHCRLVYMYRVVFGLSQRDLWDQYTVNLMELKREDIGCISQQRLDHMRSKTDLLDNNGDRIVCIDLELYLKTTHFYTEKLNKVNYRAIFPRLKVD